MVEPLSKERASRGDIACLALGLTVLIKQDPKRLDISGTVFTVDKVWPSSSAA
jgi:hypothetical protein